MSTEVKMSGRLSGSALDFCPCLVRHRPKSSLRNGGISMGHDGGISKAERSLDAAAIAVLIISIVGIVSGTAIGLYYFYIFVKKTRHAIRSSATESIATSPGYLHMRSNRHTLSFSRPEMKLQIYNDAQIEKLRQIQQKHVTFMEVLHMTDNFRTKLGQGAFGPVYYGKQSCEKEAAVKRLSSTSLQGSKEFINEVDLLSRVHHEHLVSLIGYCCERNERILIYEYMPKGNLHDHLHGRDAVREPLSWVQRLRIAIHAAKGLEYLHTRCKPRIIHRDVKSRNILLDEKLRGKVADFGLSKLVHEQDLAHGGSTGVKGTIGYLDPEYLASERPTEKSDVYSFGIVLLELICGRKPIVEISDPPDIQNISDWARSHIQAGNMDIVLDKSLGKNFCREAVSKVAEIALSSVENQSRLRPTMSELLSQLKQAMKVEVKAGRFDKESSTSTSSLSLRPM